MRTDVLLPCAIDSSGRIVSIQDVENGAACNCTCPGCSAPVIAKQGPETQWHFAHKSTHFCVGAYESAAHKLAKQMVLASQSLCIPADGRERAPYKGRPYIVRLSSHQHEPWRGDFRPDLIVAADEQEIGVEIFVAHRVDLEKRDKYEQQKLPCLEINLENHLDLLVDDRRFRAAVLVEAPRSWVYHPFFESPN